MTIRSHRPRLALVGAVVFCLTLGCGSTPEPTPLPVMAAPAPTTQLPVLAESRPIGLSIPAINLSTSDLIEVGLQPNGEMEVPTTAESVGWYTESPTPGERGPAVLAGHVDWKGPGVFFRLHRMRAGNQVVVTRADRTRALFRVTKVKRYPKNQFPSQEVYGDVPGAELRLITCGGEFDRTAGSHLDNIVVFAELVITNR